MKNYLMNNEDVAMEMATEVSVPAKIVVDATMSDEHPFLVETPAQKLDAITYCNCKPETYKMNSYEDELAFLKQFKAVKANSKDIRVIVPVTKYAKQTEAEPAVIETVSYLNSEMTQQLIENLINGVTTTVKFKNINFGSYAPKQEAEYTFHGEFTAKAFKGMSSMYNILDCTNLLKTVVKTKQGDKSIVQLHTIYQETTNQKTKDAIIEYVYQALAKRAVAINAKVSRINLERASKKVTLLQRAVYLLEKSFGGNRIYVKGKEYKYAQLARTQLAEDKTFRTDVKLTEEQRNELFQLADAYNIELPVMYAVEYLTENEQVLRTFEFSKPVINVFTGAGRKDVSTTGIVTPECIAAFKFKSTTYKQVEIDKQLVEAYEMLKFYKQHGAEFLDKENYGYCKKCGVYRLSEGCAHHAAKDTEILQQIRAGVTELPRHYRTENRIAKHSKRIATDDGINTDGQYTREAQDTNGINGYSM